MLQNSGSSRSWTRSILFDSSGLGLVEVILAFGLLAFASVLLSGSLRQNFAAQGQLSSSDECRSEAQNVLQAFSNLGSGWAQADSLAETPGAAGTFIRDRHALSQRLLAGLSAEERGLLASHWNAAVLELPIGAGGATWSIG